MHYRGMGKKRSCGERREGWGVSREGIERTEVTALLSGTQKNQ